VGFAQGDIPVTSHSRKGYARIGDFGPLIRRKRVEISKAESDETTMRTSRTEHVGNGVFAHLFGCSGLVASGLVSLLAFGCDKSGPDNNNPLIPSHQELPFEDASFELLVRALRVETPGVKVFRTQSEWAAFWEEHLNVWPRIEAPIENFEATMLVGLFWGKYFEGCGEVVDVVRMVTADRGAIHVECDSLPWLGPCRAIQQPMQLIRTTAMDLPVLADDNGPQAFEVRVTILPTKLEFSAGDEIDIRLTNRSEKRIYARTCPVAYEILQGERWLPSNLIDGHVCGDFDRHKLLPGEATTTMKIPVMETTTPGTHRVAYLVHLYNHVNSIGRTFWSDTFEVVGAN
jgi:hypothetical protein